MKAVCIKILALLFIVLALTIAGHVSEQGQMFTEDSSESLYGTEQAYNETGYSEPESVLSVEDAKTGAMMATIKEMTNTKNQKVIANYKLLMSHITESEATITVVFPVDIWLSSGGSPDTRWNSTIIYDKYTGECISFTIT